MNRLDWALGSRPAPPSSPPAAGSAWPWWALVAAVLVIDGFRVPSLVEQLRAEIPTDLSERVGNATLSDAALNVGAYSSLMVVPVVLGFCAAAAGILEPRVFPHYRTIAGARVGIVLCTVGVVLMFSRVASFLPLTAPTRIVFEIALGLSSAVVLAWWICPDPRRPATWARGAGLGAVFGVALCVG